jgi:hypothetical protein
MTIDAQVGDDFQGFAAQFRRRQIAIQHRSHQIRFRSRRGFFARRETKDGTHSDFGMLRSAVTAPIACECGLRQFIAIPMQLKLHQPSDGSGGDFHLVRSQPRGVERIDGGKCRRSRTKVGDQRLRRVGHYLARIEEIGGIENLLDRSEHAIQRPILFRDKPATGQPIAVFAADRASHRHDFAIQVGRQSRHAP